METISPLTALMMDQREKFSSSWGIAAEFVEKFQHDLDMMQPLIVSGISGSAMQTFLLTHFGVQRFTANLAYSPT